MMLLFGHPLKLVSDISIFLGFSATGLRIVYFIVYPNNCPFSKANSFDSRQLLSYAEDSPAYFLGNPLLDCAIAEVFRFAHFGMY